jgi:sulfur-oxidizing protein SoxX
MRLMRLMRLTHWVLAAPLLAAGAHAEPGDAARGRLLVADRTQSLCLLCHALTAAGDANQGNLAPPLAGVAARLSAKGLRDRIADMRRFNPATVMPPFRSTEGLRDVAPAWQGKPAMTEQQLDDIVAYLATLAP